jgi:hypothetical protein
LFFLVHIGTISQACLDDIFRPVLASDMQQHVPIVLFARIYVEIAVIRRQKAGEIYPAVIADPGRGFFKRGARRNNCSANIALRDGASQRSKVLNIMTTDSHFQAS